ncbi:AMP-binding protein [Clostridiisalibacter paucivorans]|uniref:AMP-binding protein n=1 Tax=Clostridiisalibacter paucivorans TaxID=408753 RepID=UPI00047BA15F|nr:AMP-binding protein [Clostridiisalibacter paucivorans]
MGLKNTTIGKYLKDTANSFPDNIAIMCQEEEKVFTWSMVDKLSDEYAKGMIALGLRKGDHMAIWASNKLEWVLCFLAASKIGVCTVTVNINYRLEEVERLLEQSDAKAIVFMDGFRDIDYIDIIHRIRERALKGLNKLGPLLKYFIHFGLRKCPNAIEIEELLYMAKDITEAQLNYYMDMLDTHDVINIQFTSGTTSTQKGVMLTHYNLINNSYHTGKVLNLSYEDRLCLAVPFFHCFGLSAGILLCIGSGTTMVLVECYRAIKVMETISSLECTALHGVPTMFSRILEHPDFYKYDFSTLRTGIVAGSSCNEKTIRGIIEKLGMKEVEIGYGQTESSPGCTQTFADDPIEKKVNTIGKPLPHIEMKVVDIETGKDCPSGVLGELCTRGYHVMKGYYKNEILTRRAIDRGGWLHTGDIGFVDDEGYYHICGRLKDMIIRGGENISPMEIEECIIQHPKIKNAQVYGVPQESYGEEVAASIQLKDGCELEIQEIKDFLSDRLAHYKIPKYIEFCDGFPITANGKVKKYVLKENMIKKMKNISFF